MIQLRRQGASGVPLWGLIHAEWLTPVATSGVVGGVIFLASLVVQKCWTIHSAEPQPSNFTPFNVINVPFFSRFQTVQVRWGPSPKSPDRRR